MIVNVVDPLLSWLYIDSLFVLFVFVSPSLFLFFSLSLLTVFESIRYVVIMLFHLDFTSF